MKVERGKRTELCPLPAKCPHCKRPLPLPTQTLYRRLRDRALKVQCRQCGKPLVGPAAKKAIAV